MYKVEFGKPDGRIIQFENITQIKYGKDMSHFSLVNEKDIFSIKFSETGFYHLIGENLNASYHDNDTAFVLITVQ